MRFRSVAVVCALALAVGCGDVPIQSTVSYERPPTAPALSAWSPGLGPPIQFRLAVDRGRWYDEAQRQAVWYEVASRPRLAPVSLPKRPRASSPPTPAPKPPAATGNCGGWDDLVASYWPADQVRTACRILMCESGGNPNAYNKSGATGLWQLLGHGGTFDPYQNTAVAYRLWLSQGWRPWVCR